jgi:hypothetical protein
MSKLGQEPVFPTEYEELTPNREQMKEYKLLRVLDTLILADVRRVQVSEVFMQKIVKEMNELSETNAYQMGEFETTIKYANFGEVLTVINRAVRDDTNDVMFEEFLYLYLKIDNPPSMFRLLEGDKIDEFKAWVKDNYQPNQEISSLWHPIIKYEWLKQDIVNNK